MTEAHALADGERVRFSRKMYYVKAGPDANTFFPYNDVAMTQPASLNGVLPGDVVDRLNSGDWAIIAGVNYYPGITNLVGPVRDAAEFRLWALGRGFVPDDQAITLPSSPAPPGTRAAAKPTILDVSAAFEVLTDAADKKRNRQLGRRLYIFLSGHGVAPMLTATPDYQEASLLAANCNKDSLYWNVGGRAYAEWFRARGIFEQVILFADCCRDLEDNVSPAILELPPWPIGRAPAGRQFYALPTMLGSRAYEREFGKPPVVRGIFSYVVVEALKNPKLYNDEGSLLASSLEQHLYTTVPSLNGKQDPIIDYPRNGPEIIFAKWFTRARQRVQIDVVPPYPGGTADLFRGVGSGTPIASHTTAM
jgi:hypothetical protein